MRIRKESTLFFMLVAASLLLQLIPLPESLNPFKPWFLGLVVAYFTLESPARLSLGLAFLLGLCADVLNGVLFGEHALRLTILVYVLLRFRYRLRFFPLWQQTAAITALLLNDRVLTVWARMTLGNYGWPPLNFWFSPLSTLLLWPMLFLAFDRLRQLTRVRSI
jgi:rod shape-determining protein MreD